MIHTLFIGADSLDCKAGITCFNSEEADLNAVMAKFAWGLIAILGQIKFGVIGGCRICQTNDLHAIVTDTEATDEMIKLFREAGIQVIRI